MAAFFGTLAATLAETGRFEDAVTTAEHARALAEAAGETDLAGRTADLLVLYRAGRAYHESNEAETARSMGR